MSLAERSFGKVRQGFAEGRGTPAEYLEACLERIERHDGELETFVSLSPDRARAAARASTERYAQGRPLSLIDGCPIGVKDIIETEDMPTQMNSPLYTGWSSGRDAACVHALRAAGAVIIGKTHTTEFAVGASPPTRNPHDRRRTPGGSSSGSAAAVGAGLIPAALGTQTAGSILRPASYCGVVGFKPSHGTLSLAGIHPLSATLDHLGTIAASIDDAWETAHAIWRWTGSNRSSCALPSASCPAPELPRRRLAWLRTEGWRTLDADSEAAFGELLDRVRAQDVEVVDADTDTDVARVERALTGAAELNLKLMQFELRYPMSIYYERQPDQLGPRLRSLIEDGAHLDAHDRVELLRARDAMRDVVRDLAHRVDAFVTLASTGPAPRGLDYTGERTFLSPWSVIGAPAFSLPLMQVDNLPLGLQVMGFDGQDEALASVASWLDAHLRACGKGVRN